MRLRFSFALISSLALGLTSCVSSQVHKDLQSRYDALEANHLEALRLKQDCKDALELAERQRTECAEERTALIEDTVSLGRSVRRLEKNYADLNKSYDFLLENNNSLLASNARENRAMLERLRDLDEAMQDKQDSLQLERETLEQTKTRLSDRERRIDELERLIDRQDSANRAVFQRVASALKAYEGKGLSVEERGGKVYVSMQNSLLFPSGSWTVNAEGKAALAELATVLRTQPELRILVEGHTDNDPYLVKGALADNWDLSVMRATAIIRVLTQSGGVEPVRFTASGRGEFDPVRPNDSAQNKALNRRTEIILAPDFEEISRLLEEMGSGAAETKEP